MAIIVEINWEIVDAPFFNEKIHWKNIKKILIGNLKLHCLSLKQSSVMQDW